MGLDFGLVFQIAGIGIIIAFLQIVLKQMGREDFANWVIFAGFAVILFRVAIVVSDLFDKVKSVFLFQS
jgi:stage III sporulation protein AC